MKNKLILDLIVVFAKLLLLFLTKIMKGKIEDKIRYHNKMQILLKLLNDMVNDRSEKINEEDFLSNLDWEKKQRYESYKNQINTLVNKEIPITISELLKINILGMNLRVVAREKEIINILLKDLSDSDKAILIAQDLSSY
jgi:hypothetical protein